jgi:hypothetical protein
MLENSSARKMAGKKIPGKETRSKAGAVLCCRFGKNIIDEIRPCGCRKKNQGEEERWIG